MAQGSTRTLWELLGNNTSRAATRGLARGDSFLELGRPAQGRVSSKCFGRPYAHGKDSLCKTLDLKQTHK